MPFPEMSSKVSSGLLDFGPGFEFRVTLRGWNEPREGERDSKMGKETGKGELTLN